MLGLHLFSSLRQWRQRWLPLVALGAAIAAPAFAEQRIDFGDYDIHYNAINSSTLTPDVAKVYRIGRAQNQGVLVISVVRKASATPQGVTSMLSGQIRNNIGQVSSLDFKEVVDGQAVYYLAPFRHDNNERMTFRVDIQPEGQASSYRLNFDQVFFLN
jgi:hypothetical protein